jgi:hypothetical protein
LYILFRAAFHYDPFVRYANAMAGHRSIKAFDFSLPNFINDLLLNNLDYGSWIGYP